MFTKGTYKDTDIKLIEESWRKNKQFPKSIQNNDCVDMLISDELSFNAEKTIEVRRGIPNDKDSPGRYNHVKFVYTQ